MSVDLALVLNLAQGHDEAGDVVRRRSGRRSERDGGKAEQRFGRGGIRLRPQIVEERAVGGNKLVQLGG